MNFAVIGAGFSGSVIANFLAKNGHYVEVFESRQHIGGNCYTERHPSGVLIHKYGPHIFHTNNKQVWDFVNGLSEFKPFINRVKVNFNNEIFSLPINLHTINQFYKSSFNPLQAERFISEISDQRILNPTSFEEQALKYVGKDLYEAFFKGYTQKQWGVSPKDLPASILKRLPLRFNYDDNYFNHKFQGIPINGYTPIFEKLLDHPKIKIKLSKCFDRSMSEKFDHIFHSGSIDSWFEYSLGVLPYRTLDFEMELHKGDFQGCAVMNYSSEDIPYTRITEHKHFAPWEINENTVIFKEFSREFKVGDIPYYPIRLLKEKRLLKEYIKLSKKERNVSFVGRLGTYRYLDMDKTIEEAIEASLRTISAINAKEKIPVFFVNPL